MEMSLMKMDVIKKKKRKGFTLIELIVVIAILGILAAIAIPKLTGFVASSKIAADKATATTIGHAAAAYEASNSGNSLTALTATQLEPTYLSTGTLAAKPQALTTGTWAVAVSTTTGVITVSDGTTTFFTN